MTAPSDLQAARRYRRSHERLESLRAQIQSHAPLLAGQGVLVLKKIGNNRFWYLRFELPADERGHKRHKSLYVGREGDQELLARVQGLLEECRRHRSQMAEIAGYLRLVRGMHRGILAATKELEVDRSTAPAGD